MEVLPKNQLKVSEPEISLLYLCVFSLESDESVTRVDEVEFNGTYTFAEISAFFQRSFRNEKEREWEKPDLIVKFLYPLLQ